MTTRADFAVSEGDALPFVLTWHPSEQRAAGPIDVRAAVADTEAWWRDWSARCTYERPVARAGAALADHAEGAHLRADRRHRGRADHLAARAARRRAQLGLPLLLAAGRDAHAATRCSRSATSTRRARGATGCCARWRAGRRTCRSCTGRPASGGCPRSSSTGCPATRDRRRCGSATPPREQFQLDVYGELIDALLQAREAGLEPDPYAWRAAARAARLRRGGLDASPTRASGRCAARAGTSPTRR